jgi:hypothetical protein
MNNKLRLSIIPVFVVILALKFMSACYAMEPAAFNENAERKWRQSLNVYDHSGAHLQLNVEDWIASTLPIINTDNEADIRSKFQRTQKVGQNIAAARFTFICEIDKRLHFISFDLRKIFISGLGSLNPEHKEVKGTDLLNQVIFPASFIEGPRPEDGSVINKIQQDKVNHILGKELVNSGTHAEESIIIYIFNDLARSLVTLQKDKDTSIVGTILEISSLKDPCTAVCMPMLKAFMENLHTNLQAKNLAHIKLAPVLENLVLVSGRKAHVESRAGMVIIDEKIKLNFDNPSNRLYSRKND